MNQTLYQVSARLALVALVAVSVACGTSAPKAKAVDPAPASALEKACNVISEGDSTTIFSIIPAEDQAGGATHTLKIEGILRESGGTTESGYLTFDVTIEDVTTEEDKAAGIKTEKISFAGADLNGSKGIIFTSQAAGSDVSAAGVSRRKITSQPRVDEAGAVIPEALEVYECADEKTEGNAETEAKAEGEATQSSESSVAASESVVETAASETIEEQEAEELASYNAYTNENGDQN